VSRSTLVFTLIAGFVGGVVGAAVIWSLQHGVISGNGARGYMAALRSSMPAMTPGILVFLIFALYWSYAARDSAATRSAEPGWSTGLHRALIVVAVAFILFPVPGLSARFAPEAGWVIAAGLVVQLGGLALAILARRALGRNWSSEVRLAESHQLVRTGVYRRLRHPIYSGVLLMYLGLALQSGRLNALAGLALAAAAYWRKIGLEEQLLKERFGSAFEDWRKGSWALIPPVL
jgi:protein-S-isoprenylcysteine O-methyltransferase Ste14